MEKTMRHGAIQTWSQARTLISIATLLLLKRLSPSSPSTMTTSGSLLRSPCGSSWPCSWNSVSGESYRSHNMINAPTSTLLKTEHCVSLDKKRKVTLHLYLNFSLRQLDLLLFKIPFGGCNNTLMVFPQFPLEIFPLKPMVMWASLPASSQYSLTSQYEVS